MESRQYDADEACAHIILLRDGLESIDEIFAATKYLPDRYIKKYKRISGLEDIKQIAYAAHILAIQTYPVNSRVNFLGWAGQTIRREIVDFVRSQKRYGLASERVKSEGETLLGTCEEPEQEFLRQEFSAVLSKALDSIGAKNRAIVSQKYLDEGIEHMSESYFKRKKRIESSLYRLSAVKELKEYL